MDILRAITVVIGVVGILAYTKGDNDPIQPGSPLIGEDENNFMINNILFTSNGHKDLNIKYWLLHFEYDFGYFLENIPDFLGDMKIYLDQSKVTSLVAHNYGSDTNMEIAKLYSHILGTQVQTLELLYDKILHVYDKSIQIKNLIIKNRTRHTRSLLPISGIFSALFGVVSEEQINIISNRITSLEQNNNKINHFVESSLSALNESYIMIKQNRHSIYDLQVYHNKVYSDLFNLTNNVNQYISINSQFLSESSQNQRLISQAKEVLTSIQHDMDTGISHLADLYKGKLPTSLIPPAKLKETLTEISGLLHSSLSLPFDLEDNLLLYYKNIFCTSSRKHNHLSIGCSIPITDSKKQLKFFKATPFPFPIKDPNENFAIAQIIADLPYIAITRDQTEVAILSKNSYNQCMDSPNSYCHLKSALRMLIRDRPVVHVYAVK